jgi:hypothetical protein
MRSDVQKFEAYLRSFRPVQPRPLPLAAHASFGPPRIVAAAVAATLIGVVSWLAVEHAPINLKAPAKVASSPQISAATLTRIGLDDEHTLDVRMDDAAPLILPCCRGPQSSLAALAKE